jgi:acetylornithine deacetylase/succinyl-diaminopimelate desuccinylase-like protein
MRGLLAATAILLVAASRASAADLSASVDGWRQPRERQIVGELADFVRIPSVAANPEGLAAMAERLRTELAQRGFEARLIGSDTGAPPVVFGSLQTPGARRTVTFYAHYDGQPVVPAEWSSPPFAPTMRESGDSGSKVVDWLSAKPPYNPEWRLFGRAASDDKSSIVAFLSAFDALKALDRKPSVNIRIFWEGEEERGSPHLARILHENAGLLRSDLWLIGDGPVHQSRTRTIYFGARGDVSVDATVYGATRALHSGHYGNWAPNPAALAVLLITQLRDPSGAILIPGYSKDVRPLTPAERKAIADLPPIDSALERELGIARPEGGEPLTLSTMRPALNIVALQSGVGARAIPAEATMTIDLRLVPDQKPEGVRHLVERYLQKLGWTVLHSDPDAAVRARSARIVRLDWSSGYPAFRSDMTSAPGQAVIATAAKAAGRRVAVLPMMGGSVPIYVFDEALKTPIVGLPIVNHDNNQHAPNENARLRNLWDGIETYAAMLSELDW